MGGGGRAGFDYIDLFAGIGGFHAVLDHAGGRCVYVSEIDREARAVYRRNWVDPLRPEDRPIMGTDIREDAPDDGPVRVPEHQVLAAGFPCQPFSKSGRQLGMEETRGTLFGNIARVLQERRPALILLENVRNIAGPRHRHEWEVIIRTLRQLGYRVSDEPTVFSPHLLPPHLGGTPQVRDRVFIVGIYIGAERVAQEQKEGRRARPAVLRAPVDGWSVERWNPRWVLDAVAPGPGNHRLTVEETLWIDTWDELVQRIRTRPAARLPGFPLWVDSWAPRRQLERRIERGQMRDVPDWKTTILLKNADFYDAHRKMLDRWLEDHDGLAGFPATRRKLEWQAGDADSLWSTIMHFRPSGLRARPATYFPALVAITQTSVYGPERRRISPQETARLQGLPRWFSFGDQRDHASYKQTGNGVAVGAAWHVLRSHVLRDADDLPASIVDAVRGAPLAPATAVQIDPVQSGPFDLFSEPVFAVN